ncbi:MAG: hypothetical protein LBJ59_11550 [Zoogloeaceae bacterium]|jgi:enoyl-CoA hydratase/carnithine racemase|nr:hypothetical protein [Zoogloeaceae bacterium]
MNAASFRFALLGFVALMLAACAFESDEAARSRLADRIIANHLREEMLEAWSQLVARSASPLRGHAEQIKALRRKAVQSKAYREKLLANLAEFSPEEMKIWLRTLDATERLGEKLIAFTQKDSDAQMETIRPDLERMIRRAEMSKYFQDRANE